MDPSRHIPLLWWIVFWLGLGLVVYLLARPWLVAEWRKLEGLLL